ncbi:MAG: protein kinase [Planctomycetes bacterium]|nr:protein kinase [Planctomycetota bacterium]
MPSQNNIRKLSESDWKLLEERADRFAEALKKGMAADWQTFLQDLSPEMRTAVLREMVKIDLDHRVMAGQKPLLEEYIARFPEIGDASSLPVDLICEEFRIRHKRGQNPDLDSYQSRFPKQYAEVYKLLEREHPMTMDTTGGGHSMRMDTIVSSPSDLIRQAAQHAPATPQKADNYEKTEMLGHGNFGEVWRAKAPGGIEVAIKVVTQPIDRDAAQRELQALELIKNLRHPCLLTTSAFWIAEGRLHIVMELAEGSMRDRLKTCKKQNQPGIPRDELLMYFADAAEGLDFLHTRKVFHRDIKPDNILLLHGHAKIADFGLARLQERQMMSVSFAGTPVYMAPESWGGKGGPRSDQYSLAFAYAELRQGRRPVEGSDFTEVMANTLEGNADLSGLPPEESKVVQRALSKKPEDRFATCSEFVAALARAVGTPMRIRTPLEADLLKEGGAAGPSSETFKVSLQDSTNAPSKKSKTPAMLGGLLSLLLVIGVVLWQFVFKGDSSKPTTSEVSKGNDPLPPIEPKKKEELPKDKKDSPLLPPNFTPAPNATIVAVGNRRLYDRIAYKLKNGEEAFFILVKPSGSLKPFYMTEFKVWNGFFAEFAEAKPQIVAKTEWRKDAPSHQPAVRVSVDEAYQFARWLGGNLPTAKQWDAAAGTDSRAGRDGPSTKESSVAIGRSEPRAYDDPIKDVGPLEIRDLAGNGREWTRDVVTSREVPLDRPTSSDLVILRGRNFTLTKPLTYADLDYEAKVPQTQFYLKSSPYTSFRVVIEAPEAV